MKHVFAICMVVCLAGGACAGRDICVDAKSQTGGSDGSSAAPFKTITEALHVVKAGDTVIVREGVYRETINIPGGQPGKPVCVKAADGQRVVLSGAVPVKGWKKHEDNVYVTTLDFRPDRLLLHYKALPEAREPDEGWWIASGVNDLTIMDAKDLRTLSHDPVGGEAYIWTNRGNVFFTVPIEAFDRAGGTLTVGRKSKWMVLSQGDRYYLKNHPSFINSPGDWAVEEENGKFLVYFQPASPEDLNAVEAPRVTRPVISVRGAENVRISGLEVAAAARNGIEIKDSHHVTVTDCIVHSHSYMGMLLRDVKDVTVRHNIFQGNDCGLTLHTTTDTVIEENEIAHNTTDGLIVSFNSAGITVRRNYIHHHLLWGHPDNIQLYYDVKNIQFVDNLLIAGGQSIMMAGTSDGLFQGNMIIGSRANSLIFGHKDAQDYRIHNNTVAFAGFSCMNLTAKDYDVRENVFVTGHSGPAIIFRDATGYSGDRNLFFNAPSLRKQTVLVSNKGWHRTLGHYQRATGYDRNSVYGDPKFCNAPSALACVDQRRIADCSRKTFYLGGDTGQFRLGDTVEINFDGVPRRIVDRNREAITVSPELATTPLTASLICNWGHNSDLAWDLRLAPASPGATLSASGGPVGSTIDIAAYQSGDFNADGQRDLPRIPPELGPEDSSGQDAQVKNTK